MPSAILLVELRLVFTNDDGAMADLGIDGPVASLVVVVVVVVVVVRVPRFLQWPIL